MEWPRICFDWYSSPFIHLPSAISSFNLSGSFILSCFSLFGRILSPFTFNVMVLGLRIEDLRIILSCNLCKIWTFFDFFCVAFNLHEFMVEPLKKLKVKKEWNGGEWAFLNYFSISQISLYIWKVYFFIACRIVAYQHKCCATLKHRGRPLGQRD